MAKTETTKSEGAEPDLESQVDALKGDLHTVKEDISSIAQLLMKQGKARATETRDNVEAKLHEKVAESRAYIEERPLTTTLYAFGIGVMAGFFFSRR